jgi:hypothetical protein
MHEKLLVRSVLKARTMGATWAEVGESLGVSQQAANERFGPLEVAKANAPRVARGQGSLAV